MYLPGGDDSSSSVNAFDYTGYCSQHRPTVNVTMNGLPADIYGEVCTFKRGICWVGMTLFVL